MVKRSYNSIEKFWSVMERELFPGGYTEAVPPHIKHILSYEDLDNFVAFQQFSGQDDFPFEQLKNTVRSEEYRQFVQKTMGSMEISKDCMVSFYGTKFYENPEDFQFSTGDTFIIKRMIKIMDNIKNMDIKDKEKMLKKCNRYPVDETGFPEPEQEIRHLKKLILNRKTQSQSYHTIKNQISFQLSSERLCATILCPVCSQLMKARKFIRKGGKSYWNLYNFNKHLDNCLNERNDIESLAASEGNFLLYSLKSF